VAGRVRGCVGAWVSGCMGAWLGTCICVSVCVRERACACVCDKRVFEKGICILLKDELSASGCKVCVCVCVCS